MSKFDPLSSVVREHKLDSLEFVVSAMHEYCIRYNDLYGPCRLSILAQQFGRKLRKHNKTVRDVVLSSDLFFTSLNPKGGLAVMANEVSPQSESSKP